MQCDKCGEINQPGAWFFLETKIDLEWINKKTPCSVYLCAYDCYPPSIKKKKNNKVLYIVSYGSDKSHLWEVKSFIKLKEAKDFIFNLSLSPLGIKRPFKLQRFEYLESNISGDIVKIKDIKI